jgi:hypothetical protein
MIISNLYLDGEYPFGYKAEISGQHQHALLNLANFYYSTGGLESAKAVSFLIRHLSYDTGNRRSSQSVAGGGRQALSAGVHEVSNFSLRG